MFRAKALKEAGLFTQILLKSYLKNSFSMLMLFSSLIIATAGLSAVLIINHSAKQSYSSKTQGLVPDVVASITHSQKGSSVSVDSYTALKRQGFNNLVMLRTLRAPLLYNGKALDIDANIIGFDSVALVSYLRERYHRNKTLESDNEIILSLPFSNSDAVILHPQFLARVKEAMSEEASNAKNYTGLEILIDNIKIPAHNLVAANLPNIGSDMIVDMHFLSRLPRMKSEQQILVLEPLSQRHNLDALNDLIEADHNGIDNESLSLTEIASSAEQAELTESFHLNLMAMGFLMFCVCLFIVLNAVNLISNARLPWLKIARQLGISRHIILAVIVVEMLVIVFITVILGLILGLYLANLAAPTIQATIKNLYNITIGYGDLSLGYLFVQIFLIALVGCSIALLHPYQQLQKSLSSLSLADNDINTKIIRIAAITCGSISLITIGFSYDLLVLLIGTATLILFGCLVLIMVFPALLKLNAKVVSEKFLIIHLSAKQSIELSKKTKVACCAFFIAVTSNIGMNLMVESFRSATDSWLTMRLASDHYIYLEKYSQEFVKFSEQSKLSITPRYEYSTTFDKVSTQVLSYPSTQSYKSAMVFSESLPLETLWKQYSSGMGVLVNQQFAIEHSRSIGDTIELEEPKTGLYKRYRLLGIFYDYGNPKKQVLMPLKSFDSTKHLSKLFAINNSSATELEVAINEFKRLYSDVEIDAYSVDELLALSMRTFDRTFLITDGLNIITLLVASLSLACALIVLLHDMRPQMMLFRSMGISKIQIQLMLMLQFGFICLVAFIAAIPFGIGLSWVLIYKINYAAFQWTYPLVFNSIDIAQLFFVSLAVVYMTVLLPSIVKVKKTLIEDIRCLNT